MFANQIKTVILLGLMSALLIGVGQLVGGPQGLAIGLVLAIGINFFSYWFSDKIVLKIYKAKPVTESENPRLYKIVKEVSHLADIPMPKVYALPSEHSNAFATGRNPKHAAVACTAGILELMNDSELKGVIAHEISHIKNRDILISSIAATIAAVIGYVAMMARWAAIFGGFGGNRDGDNGGIIELIVLAVVTPLIATLIQLAISRSREFLADESAAKILHNPFGLASALEKLDSEIKRKPLKAMASTESTAHMFIANPFRAKGFVSLFRTHPPMKERIKRLKGMAG